jgi:hypothetical protein
MVNSVYGKFGNPNSDGSLSFLVEHVHEVAVLRFENRTDVLTLQLNSYQG